MNQHFTIISILLIITLGLPPQSFAQTPDTGLRKLYAEQANNAVAALRKAIRSGTPDQKEEALWVVRDNKILSLIPDVIHAVGDPTPLPRREDSGWGFVAHQAASTLSYVATTLDGISLKERGYDKYSFHNDMYKGGKALQETGRLSELRTNWEIWWQEYKLKHKH